MSECVTSFVHLFETENNKYSYDVNTNEIVRIDDVCYEYLRLLQSGLPKAEACTYVEETYDVSDVNAAVESIDELIDNDVLFASNRPATISMFCCDNTMEDYYDNYINQVTLEVTQNCNCSCRYCAYSGIYENNRTNNEKKMSWETAQKGLDYMLRHGGRDPNACMLKKNTRFEDGFSIAFYGGEPLLNMELIERCVLYMQDHAPKSKKVRYSLTTNGVLLTERLLDFFVKNDFSLLLSLDGPKDVHDRARVYSHGGGTYDDVIRAIELINRYARSQNRNTPIEFSINCVVVGGISYKHLLDYFASMEELLWNGYVRCSISLSSMTGGVDKWNGAYPEMKLPPATDYDDIKQEYRDACIRGVFAKDHAETCFRDKVLHDFVFKSFYFDIHARTRFQFSDECKIAEQSYPGSICKLGARRLFMRTDGTLLPCERVPTENPNLHVGRIEQGLNLDRITQLLDDFTNATVDDCRDCWCYRMCSVECVGDNYKNGDTFEPEVKRRKCNSLRERRHREIVEMMELLEECPTALDHYNDIAVE